MPEFWHFLFPLSTEIGGSHTGEQDRYGVACDLSMHAVRIGNVALLLVPEGEEHHSIYGPFPLSELAERARKIHEPYDMGEFSVCTDPAELRDRFRKVAGALTRAYRPDPGFTPTDPAEPGIWAWIDNRLYLSCWRWKRVGVTRGVQVFDDNLAALFRAIGIRVDAVVVRYAARYATWPEAVLAAVANRRREEIVTRLRKITSEIESLQRKLDEQESKRKKIEAELAAGDAET